MRVLAVFAGSFSAAVFGANYLLLDAFWLPAGLGLAGSCLVWCVVGVRRGGRLRLGAALVMAGAGLGLVWSAGYDRVFLEPARALDGTTVRLTATAVQWPEPSRYDGVSVEVWAQVPEGPPVRALLYLDEQGETLRPGDRLETVARCHLADRSTGGEETDYYLSRGVFLWCTGYGLLTVDGAEEPPLWALPACLARALRESIGALFPARETGLIQAVVLGERDGLEESYSTALQRVGLSHTVAVSGMHLGFLAGLLGTLLGKHSRRSALVIFPTVVCFAMMTGCTPSVVRAAVMILLLQLAPLLGREQDGPTSLSFALMLLLLHNPFAAAHVGLQLSFASVAGIELFSEKLRRRIDFLADSLCEGRATGTRGATEAAFWITGRFKEAGLLPADGTYSKSFMTAGGIVGHNIAGILPGSRTKPCDSYIIIGAHYDHLGILGGKVYPGADSNASGTVALTTLAGMFATMKTLGKSYGKNLIFVAFDGQCMNLSGSYSLWRMVENGDLKDPLTGETVTKDKISLMVNIDQIGCSLSPLKSGRKDYLIMLGNDRLEKEDRDKITQCNLFYGTDLEISHSYYGSKDFTRIFYTLSDQRVFIENGVPAVLFTSGITMNNNKTYDSADTLDYNVLRKRIILIFHWIEKML